MARAVPQLPAPMTPAFRKVVRLGGSVAMRVSFRGGLFLSETIFRSVEESRDVFAMTADDEQRCDTGEGESSAIAFEIVPLGEEGEQGKAEGRSDRGERHVSSDCQDTSPDGENEEALDGHERQHNAEGGRDPFAAAESQPDGVVVTEDGSEPGDRPTPSDGVCHHFGGFEDAGGEVSGQ